eukprot:82695_1
MNAFTVLLAAFGLGLATAAQQVMPCDVKYGALMAELQECSKMVNLNAKTLEMGITSAKNMCKKCVRETSGKSSELETPKCKGMDLTNVEKKFTTAGANALKACSDNKAALCAAAEDFLTGKKSTLARAQKIANTNMACTCAKPDMRPKNITKATCSQRKMKFNCAKLGKKNAGNDKDDKKDGGSAETTSDGAKMVEATTDGETCLQLFARDRADFCKSECVKMLQEAGGQLDEKCRDDSPDYDEFNLDFEKTCKCEDMKCLEFRDSKTDSESEKSSANSAQVGLASAVVSMMVVVFSA